MTLWDGETGRYTHPSAERHKLIWDRLLSYFPHLWAFDFIFPWIILQFEDEPPPIAERPFHIAGLVAVFLAKGEPFPHGILNMGHAGLALPHPTPSEFKEDIRPYHNSNGDTIKYLFSVIPQAEFISIYARQILFELAPMSDDDFESFLLGAPRAYGLLVAMYNNGQYLHELSARTKKTDPQFDKSGGEISVDDTNYLSAENGGEIRPGCMLECYANDPQNDSASPQCQSNSGILITRGGTTRLTCALHTWDRVSPKKAYHAGVYIGDVDEALSEDIGLINPVVPVSNEFLEIKTKARNLIRAEDIGDHDLVCVDSCFSGPQTLQSAGSRWGKRYAHGEGDPSYPNTSVVLEQRIFTASAPFVPAPPVVRLGMCGTPLLRVGNALDTSVTAERGDILGFFLWCDIKSYSGPSLLCYAQACNPLIDEGWTVAAR